MPTNYPSLTSPLLPPAVCGSAGLGWNRLVIRWGQLAALHTDTVMYNQSERVTQSDVQLSESRIIKAKKSGGGGNARRERKKRKRQHYICRKRQFWPELSAPFDRRGKTDGKNWWQLIHRDKIFTLTPCQPINFDNQWCRKGVCQKVEFQNKFVNLRNRWWWTSSCAHVASHCHHIAIIRQHIKGYFLREGCGYKH